jgi:hypothetical protein
VVQLTTNLHVIREQLLKGDQKARDMFIGMSCGLCGHSDDYDYGEHSLQ